MRRALITCSRFLHYNTSPMSWIWLINKSLVIPQSCDYIMFRNFKGFQEQLEGESDTAI